MKKIIYIVLGFIFLSGCSIDSEDTIKKETDNPKETVVEKVDGSVPEETESTIQEQKTNQSLDDSLFEGYTIISANSCSLSGSRQPNVAVDIGYGDREYWAFTNEHGQLVKVVAKEIILQKDTDEVLSSGRYCRDEAKVPGVERSDLDEGHVIADSLGGVSNAYNITPQNSTLNRHGDQAYMEKVIRDAGGCTDFIAIITYPDTQTQIPSHYKYTYTLKGNVITDEFDNINPEANKGSSTSSNQQNNTATPPKTNKNESTGTVYWTPRGKSYHASRDCPTLSRSKTISSGTIAESNKTDPCDRCH